MTVLTRIRVMAIILVLLMVPTSAMASNGFSLSRKSCTLSLTKVWKCTWHLSLNHSYTETLLTKMEDAQAFSAFVGVLGIPGGITAGYSNLVLMQEARKIRKADKGKGVTLVFRSGTLYSPIDPFRSASKLLPWDSVQSR